MRNRAPNGIQVPNLRAWRLWAGLSQDELAAQAGVHKITLQDIERGTLAQFSTVGRLSRALGIERIRLLHGLPEPDMVSA